MLAGLNLSRRDAWKRVTQYVGLWLVFWLLIGFAGQTFHSDFAPPEIADAASAEALNVPLPPRLFDPAERLVLKGRVDRQPVRARSAGLTTQTNVLSGVDSRRTMTLPDDGAMGAPITAQALDAAGFKTTAPPGFEDLLGVQNTQADVYFQGRMLVSTFIEFDISTLWFLAPEEVTDAIPTLKNPGVVLGALTGPLPNNSQLLCSVRVRTNCGELSPDIAGVIFDEGKFRIDLFIAQDELEVQLVVGDRYLPAPTAGWGTLHDMSFSASGAFGNDRFSLAGESFLSKGEGRARVRYGVTNTGPSLHEASWQWDKRDREYEAGAFRSARGNSLFVNDLRLLGVRISSSTKTRTDLDNALATPVFAFLERRSRVDILRDGNILDSRFYEAGNHQLDTTRLPDGAYDITVRTVTADGRETNETHFFVRDSLLPPLGENQYFVELGAFTEDYGSQLPRATGSGWLRGGLSHRLNEGFALEGEALISEDVNLLQAGVYFLGRGWQVHAGALASDRGDHGLSFRGQLQRKGYSVSLNAQHLQSKTPTTAESRFDPLLTSNASFAMLDPEALDLERVTEVTVLGGSYTQASASLSFPLRLPFLRGSLAAGRAHLRARYNKRGSGAADTGIGFNYHAPLFKRRLLAADFNFEGLYSNNRSLVRLGVDFRWRDRRQSSVVRPELIASRSAGERDTGADGLRPAITAYWNRNYDTERYGQLLGGAFLNHDDNRSTLGGRLSSQSKFGFSELELAYQDGRGVGNSDGLTYATNSRFSLVSTEGKSALGGGTSQLAAIVVEIDGDLPDADFQVIVGSRVAGYASTSKRAVVSVRPYETYRVRIVPAGDDILGYDQRSHEVTLFPGNVHRLTFSAHQLHVLVSQAMLEGGEPLRFGKFVNVEGFGASDADGWFQVEVAHSDPLIVRQQNGNFCKIEQPPIAPEDDHLAVVDALVCRPTPAPPSS